MYCLKTTNHQHTAYNVHQKPDNILLSADQPRTTPNQEASTTNIALLDKNGWSILSAKKYASRYSLALSLNHAHKKGQ